MTKDKKSTRIAYVFMLSLIFVFLFVQLVTATGEPGSTDDPVVSKSYVDSLVQDLRNQINTLKNQTPSSGSSAFETISISAGQYLYTGSGTEIVVRSGFAKALLGTTGAGLSDVTSATDLSNGVIVPKNHLLISARDDNRGIYATTVCYVLVRGSYKVSGQATSTTPTDNNTNSSSNSNGSTNTNNSGTSVTTPKTGVVTASTLNIRASASATAAIVAKATIGDTVTILSTTNGWYKVKTSSGVTGWASSSYITIQ